MANDPSTITMHVGNSGVIGVLAANAVSVKEQIANGVINYMTKGRTMGKYRAMQALVQQYAPNEDTAWGWMRRAYEMGWMWGNQPIGIDKDTIPVGQRAARSVATAFHNGRSIYVGIVLVAGEIRWAWFTDKEWGAHGRDLVLGGYRNHHPDPITAITEYTLRGEEQPRPAGGLDDVFGGDWDDNK